MLATLASMIVLPMRAESYAVWVALPTSEVRCAISLTVAEICWDAEAACSVCISTWLLLSPRRRIDSLR
ncbi:hypothetical protein FQZ97_1172750 [compost metagenome]